MVSTNVLEPRASHVYDGRISDKYPLKPVMIYMRCFWNWVSVANLDAEMYDVACQLVLKWARFGSSHEIDPTDDFIRVAWDTIGLCALDTRFNSFYRETQHPFVGAMVFFLKESGKRSMRPQSVSDYIYRSDTKYYWECIDLMHKMSQDAIDKRKNHPTDKPDLLNAMLKSVDPKTGNKMTELSVMQNTITFLAAGKKSSVPLQAT